MMTSMLLVMLCASPSPLDAARAHLQKGQLDDVLFDLEGKTLSPADQPEAVKVLSAASKAALVAKDAVMAQHLASMALKLDAKSVAALEAASRAALAQQEFELAEKHADGWLAVEPSSPAARQLRAELAVEAGEWQRVVELAKAVKPETPALTALRVRAERELAQRSDAMSQLDTLTKQLEEALKKRPSGPVATSSGSGRSSGVVIYGTSWCQYCKKARDWFNAKGISYVERDMEKDPQAVTELATKAQAQGVAPTGVPILDVYGQLIVGFDVRKIEAALQR